MPELPEVETTRLGIRPHLLNRTITQITVRESRLRVPVTSNINGFCQQQSILDVTRRAKYLILHLGHGAILIHLGMSGNLRILTHNAVLKKHDHIDVCLDNNTLLRYHDPRRFGLFIYLSEPVDFYLRSKNLGPEPLSSDFTADYLFKRIQSRRQSIKSFIMSNQIVVGVGNIYATESLFLSGIHPKTTTELLKFSDCINLVTNIREVLSKSIQAGGTTLRDFLGSDGKPGYFANELLIYGKKNSSCPRCKTLIESTIIAGRSSFYCPTCQPLFLSQY